MNRRLAVYAAVFAAGVIATYLGHHSVRAERTALREELSRTQAQLDTARADLQLADRSRPASHSRARLAMLAHDGMLRSGDATDSRGPATADATAVSRPGDGASDSPAPEPASERASEPASGPGPDTSAQPLTEPQKIAEVRTKLEDHASQTAGAHFRTRLRKERALLEELRELGSDAAVAALTESLYEATSSHERRAAASLLGGLGDDSALAVLLEVVYNDDDVLVRRGAMRGLRLMGSETTIPLLREVAVDVREDRFVRFQAAYGLAQLGEPSGVQGLVSLLDDVNQDGTGRHLVFRVLKHLDDPAAISAMRQFASATAPDISYQIGALEFLGRHGTEDDAELILNVLNQNDVQPAVVEAAESAYRALAGN